jgi:hypothetical protein
MKKLLLLTALIVCAGCKKPAPAYNYVAWDVEFGGHNYLYVQGHGSGGLVHAAHCTNHCQ